MHTKFGGAQSRDRDFRGRKSAKSGQVCTSISRLLPTLMNKDLCFLNILLAIFNRGHSYLFRLGKKFSLFFSFFFYHYLLLNHKTHMDHTLSYYRYPKVLVPA